MRLRTCYNATANSIEERLLLHVGFCVPLTTRQTLNAAVAPAANSACLGTTFKAIN